MMMRGEEFKTLHQVINYIPIEVASGAGVCCGCRVTGREVASHESTTHNIRKWCYIYNMNH
jgi:hypothetical protein